MKIYKDLEQGTDEWFEVRKLKLTASNAQAIGNSGKGLETYVTEIMAEYYSTAPRDSFTTKDMERGKELEGFAREMYELEKDVEIEEVGFIEDSKYIGCSPDGLIGKDGGIEIKCLNDVKHYKLLRDGFKEIETKYLWQVQMCLLITGRKWWDLVFYNPNFKDSMFIFRVTLDSENQSMLKVGIKKGVELIKNQLKNYGKKI